MTTDRDHDDIVRAGYDQIAERYLADRDRWKSEPYLDWLLGLLRPNSQVLDVGCGAAVPVGSYLADHGHEVIGVDVSPRQIELARRNLPNARFEDRDMRSLTAGEYTVDAVVSFFAVFHTPRESHGSLFETLATFLPPDGPLLVTMGSKAWEGEEDFHGHPMWWSHYGMEENLSLVESAGFEIIRNEIDETGGERHLVVLARKR